MDVVGADEVDEVGVPQAQQFLDVAGADADGVGCRFLRQGLDGILHLVHGELVGGLVWVDVDDVGDGGDEGFEGVSDLGRRLGVVGVLDVVECLLVGLGEPVGRQGALTLADVTVRDCCDRGLDLAVVLLDEVAQRAGAAAGDQMLSGQGVAFALAKCLDGQPAGLGHVGRAGCLEARGLALDP